jgi:aspartyl-tRNA(Asn)/glutamyl-tRNA(Gln) amidotransferase subunit A
MTFKNIVERSKDTSQVLYRINQKLDNIKKFDKDVNSFNTVLDTNELEDYVKNTKAKSNKTKGIVSAFKDIYSTKNIKTTASSNIIKDYIPPYSATSYLRMIDSGSINIGKLNSDAFAHGSTGNNSDMGYIKNPYDLTKSAGGSSSGSGAAVAAEFVDVAFGTDTGGSIRNPASWCNCVGIKPTYGRVSRFGIIAMAASLDSIGHITKRVEDNAYILNITAGFDSNDGTSSKEPVDDYTSGIGKDIKGLKLGVPKEYLTKGLNNEIRQAFEESLRVFERLGAEIVDISLPTTEYALAAYYIICPSEISSNLARFDGIRYGYERDHFGLEAKRRIMIGTYALSSGYYDAYYDKALRIRTLVINDFKSVFKKVDAIVAPIVPALPTKLGQNIDDPLQDYLLDVLAVPVNLAGVPALAVPAGFSKEKLPIGIQIIGNYFTEKLLYQIGHAFESETKYYLIKPSFLDSS